MRCCCTAAAKSHQCEGGDLQCVLPGLIDLRQRQHAGALQQAAGDQQRPRAEAIKGFAGQRDGQERRQRPGQHQAADLGGGHPNWFCRYSIATRLTPMNRPGMHK